MAYLQRNIPPANQHLNFVLESMAGGLNNTDFTPEHNQAVLIKNMSFSDGDAMGKRKGTKYYDDNTFTNVVEFIDYYKPYDKEPIQITSTKNNIYANGTRIASVEDVVCGTTFAGNYLFVDGKRFRSYGTFPQSGSTYVKIIGDATEEMIVMNIVDAPEGYTPLDKEHTRGVTVYDYSSKQVWYEPCEFEIEDPYNGASVVPLNTRFLVGHNGRLFVSGNDDDDDNIFISHIQNPYYFPVSLPLQPTPNADRIKGLIVYDDSVVVGRGEDIHVITGNSNNPDITNDLFRMRKLNTHTGFANNSSVNVVHNYLFFLGSDGVCYALSSVNQSNHLLLTTVISNSIDLFKEPISFDKQDVFNAKSIFYDNEWYLSINNKVLVYSYEHRAWTVYYNLNARCFTIYDFDLIWGNNDGRLITFSDNYLDLGAPFECRIETKNFDLGNPILYKYFREFSLVAHVFADFASDIRVSFEIDYLRVNHKNSLRSQMSRWGISKWGDRFINNDINISFPLFVHRRGRYLKFIFANGWDVSHKVYAIGDLENILNVENEETLAYVELEDKYFLRSDNEWVELTDFELNQAMKVYELNGDYTLRSKR